VQESDITRLSESQLAAWRSRNIGFVFQFYNLLPVLSALENVALPLSLLNMSRKERVERAKFALEIVGLSDRLDHYPAQLSGGQEQRVAIARAIVTDPSIIVADEPTGDLDRKSADDVMNLISRLNGEFSKTIIMVTHDQSVAGFARRTVTLDKGRIPE
jgi:putative ABC transport system ATP-binding protein